MGRRVRRGSSLARAAVVGVTTGLLATGCPPPEVTLRREMTGAFSEQDTPVVLELTWTTTDPEAPYFNAENGTDWVLTLSQREAGPGVGGSGVGETGGQTLATVEGPEAQSGAFAYQPLYWHEAAGRIVGSVYGEVWLMSEPGAAWRSLTAPPARLVEHFGPEGAEVAALLDAPLSPDGDTVAAFYVYAYVGPGGPFDLRFDHAVFFWDAATGDLVTDTGLDWPDDRVDPHLRHPAPVPHQPRVLWRADSAGVFVLDQETARFLPREPGTGFVDVEEVPERALPTSSGWVSRTGAYFVAPPETPNEGTVHLEEVAGWIPFDELTLVPLSSVDYAVPRPD